MSQIPRLESGAETLEKMFDDFEAIPPPLLDEYEKLGTKYTIPLNKMKHNAGAACAALNILVYPEKYKAVSPGAVERMAGKLERSRYSSGCTS